MKDNSYLAKEIITVLDNFDKEFLDKIPEEFINEFKELSKQCDVKIFIDDSKDLVDQNVSQECKDFISIMYYYYHADDDEKKELIKTWNNN